MKSLTLTFIAILFSVCSFAIGPISGNTTLCPGQCTQLSNATPGGTWSTSGTVMGTVGVSTGVVCANSYPYGSSFVVTYMTSSGNATATVTIVASPGPIMGNTGVCAGTVTTLSDSTSGGVWSIANLSIATIDPTTGVVNGLTPGSTIVSYTSIPGCVVTSTVSVFPSICTGPVTIPTVVKTGCSTDTVSVTNYCGASFQWQQSADNITWTNIPSANSFRYIFSPSASYYYRCILTCISSGSVSMSTPALINITNPTIHSLINPIPDTACTGLNVNVSVCGTPAAYNVTTYFGDGSSTNTVMTTTGTPTANITHLYEWAGTYTIKHVLYNGTAAVDSTSYSYNYLFCRMLPVKLFQDNNSNCIKDAGEINNFTPITIEIDSNGVAIDTISVLSGFYYKALGTAGTIYGFKPLSTTLSAACITAGILYDTIQSYVNNYPVKYIALTGAPSGSFDLSENTTAQCGRHAYISSVTVRNLLPTPQSATLTVNFSPKYNFMSGTPAPASVTGTSITWNFSNLSSTSAAPTVSFYLEVPGTWLLPGDTVHTSYTIQPTTGDANSANNFIARVDTVTSSFDPNYVECDPKGYFLPGAQLQYAIHFENTGNDTADNIYVMDTLSGNLDPNTLQIVSASADMTITKISDGAFNIVKFDFPNIKLLDSSHHGLCDGFVTYNIMPLSGLADGTSVFAHAGIFFDDNPVVMTDVIENKVAYMNGPTSVCQGQTITLTELAQGGTWTSSNANATVVNGVVTGVTAGSATISYTRTYSNGPISVSKVVTVNTSPNAGIILGSSGVCTGSSIVLTNSTTGGTWGISNNKASLTGTTVTGLAPGTDTVSYTVNNTFCTSVAQHVITVSTTPNAGSISGSNAVCAGNTITLTTTGTGGTWSAFNGNASVSTGGIVTGISNGTDTIYYSVTNICGTAKAKQVITVSPAPNPGIITGADTVCLGGNIILTPSVTGGVWSVYTGNANVGGGVVTGFAAGLDSVYYTVTNSCGSKRTAKAVYVKVCPASVIPLNSDNSVVIYPNPTNGLLTIITDNRAYSSFTITNAAGQVIMQQQMNATQTDVHIDKLAAGIYYITLKGNYGVTVKKITKM